ncbi:phosphopantetheine-binding protein [Streptomyces sp. NPDC058307]|uniref:phosphopantetheine-binding protein n=1 Tax=Streptomyces sp. NPDC058307 TaxID=3346439 RepID=UPI0036EB152A
MTALDEKLLREIRAIVTDCASATPPDDLGDDDDIIQLGIVDSLSLMEMVAAVNARLGIWVDDSELVARNFGSIRSIHALLAGKGR